MIGNILSYDRNTKIKGSDVKAWIRYHMEHETSHTKEAIRMRQYLNIKDDKYYFVRKGKYQASSRKYCVVRANDESDVKIKDVLRKMRRVAFVMIHNGIETKFVSIDEMDKKDMELDFAWFEVKRLGEKEYLVEFNL